MQRVLILPLLALSILFGQACGNKRIPVVVGQTGLAVVQSIGALQNTTKQLTDKAVLTPQIALQVQTRLLALNEKAKPLPDILRSIDAAGSVDGTKVDQAISILTALMLDLHLVTENVPINDAAKALIDAVQATHTTITTTLVEVAKLKGAQ